MENLPNNFFKKLKKDIRLEKHEKDSVKQSLLTYMGNHPVRKELDLRLNTQTQRSSVSLLELLTLLKHKPMTILISLILMATLGIGGVSMAAEGSVPGDALYPVKIGVTENIKSAVAFSQEAKAGVEIDKVARRLQETERLAVRGQLNQKLQSKVETRFATHIEKMTSIAADLEAKGNVEAASELRARLDALLEVHEEVLIKLGQEKEIRAEAQTLINNVRTDLRQRINSNAEMKLRVETKIREQVAPQVQSAAEGKLNAAENKLTEVEKFIDRKDIDVNSATNSRISIKLQEAKGAIAEGKVKMESEQYADAFLLFQKSAFLSQQAKMLANVHIDLSRQRQSNKENDRNSTSTESNNDDEEEDDEENNEVEIEGELNIQLEL